MSGLISSSLVADLGDGHKPVAVVSQCFLASVAKACAEVRGSGFLFTGS